MTLTPVPSPEAAPEDQVADPEARASAWAARCGELEVSLEDAETRAKAAEHSLHMLLDQIGRPVTLVEKRDSHRVPIQRADHEVLVDIADLLTRQVATLEHIRAAVGASGSISSVELEVDSKATVKPHVKVYDLDPEHANNEAQRIFDGLIIKYGPKA